MGRIGPASESLDRDQEAADAAFIAAARSLLPAALLQIEHLAKEALDNARLAIQRGTEIERLEATVAARAQEIGRLRATDAGTEIAPGVRLVWQRGDVGVLTFEPGATVPEESHDRDEVGVVIDGSVAVCPVDCRPRPGRPDHRSPKSWIVPAREPHTMTAGPEGAIVGVRWVSADAPARDDADALLTRMRAAERAATPLTSYMPIDGLSAEAMVDGLRGMALGALRSLKDSGRRAVGVKLIVIEEGFADAITGTLSVVRDLAGRPAALSVRGRIL